MRSETSWKVRWQSWTLAAAALTSACTSSGKAPPVRVEIQDGGFTVTQEVRVGGRVRADFDRALGALEAERYEEGIVLLREVTEAAPFLASAHVDLGIAYRRNNELESAEASLKRALELSPRHPVVHNELGILYRRTGRFQEARRSYERALAIHPEFHFARRNLAILCDLYLENTACALENYELYTRAVPDDQNAAMWVADLHNRVGE